MITEHLYIDSDNEQELDEYKFVKQSRNQKYLNTLKLSNGIWDSDYSDSENNDTFVVTSFRNPNDNNLDRACLGLAVVVYCACIYVGIIPIVFG